MKETIGIIAIAMGSILGIIGGVVNAFFFHNLAIQIWTISNFFLLLWAVGNKYGKWNATMSNDALIAMYGTFTICNLYALGMM
jgi:type IV secretory pathway TrbD component